MKKHSKKNRMLNKREILRFLIPSLIGLFLFLFPIPYNGKINIPLGIISEIIANFILPYARYIVTGIVCISALFSFINYFFHPSFIQRRKMFEKHFSTSFTYLIIRMVAAIFAIFITFQFGPVYIISENTGITMMDLLGTLVAWFFTASFIMPLLTDFGTMEFVGVLAKNAIYPLFRIPGRSAIDLLASWVGNANVGVIITSKQYEEGYYSAREAGIISTCFSAVSLPFCIVIAALLGVDDNFFLFYLILILTSFILIFIMVRIPPLVKMEDSYYLNKPVVENKVKDPTTSLLKWALLQAIDKAKTGPSFKSIILNGIDTFLGIILSLTPIVVTVGTITLIVTNYTNIFNYISLPFAYYLQFLGVEEAFAAAPAVIAGFADMIIPAVIGASIVSYRTRFIIGVLSLVQIIYMTEVGSVILTSKIPIKFKDLFIIYVLKTIIAIPIIISFTIIFGIS